MSSQIPKAVKAYRWYVKTLIGCSILTGLSFCVHCGGKITPTTWLIVGNGRIGVGSDWAWIRHRIHPTSGVPSGEWTLTWAKYWGYNGFGDYSEFSLFILLLACWLLHLLGKNLLSQNRQITSGDWWAVIIAVGLAMLIAFVCHVAFDGNPRFFSPQVLKHITTVGFAMVPAILIEKLRSIRHRQLEMRELSTLCHSCRYDLIGNVNNVCPECGLVITPQQWAVLTGQCGDIESAQGES